MVKTPFHEVMMGFIIISFILFFLYFGFFEIDEPGSQCLDEFAKKYCQNNNMKFFNRGSLDYFFCLKADRTSTERLYFADAEKQLCRVERGMW